MYVLFSSTETMKGGNSVNGNSLHIPFYTFPLKKICASQRQKIKRNNKNQVKQPTAQKSLAKPAFPFNGQRFSPEILTARGQRTLFAKAQATCSTRQLSEIPVEPNDNRITALILSIPAFIV